MEQQGELGFLIKQIYDAIGKKKQQSVFTWLLCKLFCLNCSTN